ncbi:rab11 family-interacting 3 isoform X2 [Pelobates cultripes]|uniref:Rab11 family-interacting 3 isoform X2 n=1 Tax=Pelobates cultripes TaxID=61616 RepID=A0AAD1WIQ7_PELCU|nr:rab11 family-interacting 3 isoform X2 [Pelobates cultripes]
MALFESCLTPDSGQLIMSESGLTSGTDSADMYESVVAPGTDQQAIIESSLSSDSDSELGPYIDQFESNLEPENDLEDPGDSGLTPEIDWLAQSELALALDTELAMALGTESVLSSDSDNLSQSETDLVTNKLSLPESSLSPDTELLAQPGAVVNTERPPLPENVLSYEEGHMSESDLAEFGIILDTEQLTTTRLSSVPDDEQLPQAKSALTQITTGLPLYESDLTPSTDKPTAVWAFTHDPNQLPFTKSDLTDENEHPHFVQYGLTPDTESPLLSQPVLTSSNVEFSSSKVCLSSEPNHYSLPECYFTPVDEKLPLSDICLSTVTKHQLQHQPSKLINAHPAEPTLSGYCVTGDNVCVPESEWFRNEDLPQTQLPLTNETEKFSLDESGFPPNQFPQIELSLTPYTENLPLSELHLPPKTDQLPLVQHLLDCAQVPLSSTGLLENCENEEQFLPNERAKQNPFKVHQIELGFSPMSDIFTSLSPETRELDCYEEDLFSLFCSDTTQELNLSSCTDHLTLSEDFLSLTEVFTHFEADLLNQQDEKEDQVGYQNSELSTHPVDQTYRAEQLDFAEFDPVCRTGQLLESLNENTSNSRTNVPVESISFSFDQSCTSVKTKQSTGDSFEDCLTPDCVDSSFKCLSTETDETPYLYLEFLFDPDRIPHEGDNVSFCINHTQIPPSSLDSSSENVELPSSSVADYLSVCRLNVENEHLPLSLSGSQMNSGFLSLSKIGSLVQHPVLPIASQLSPANLCSEDFPISQTLSDSSLDSSQMSQSNFKSPIEINQSQLGSLNENSRLPLIVVTNSLDESSQFNQVHSLDAKENMTQSLETFLPESVECSKPQIDVPLVPDLLPPCDIIEQLPLLRSVIPQETKYLPPTQAKSQLDDDDDFSPCELVDQSPQSQTVVPYEESQLTPTSAPVKLSLSFISSTYETDTLPSCEVTGQQPISTHDSSAPSTEELVCDPGLGFPLDTDSSCLGEEVLRLRAVFDALDRDKDGFVKMEDFVQFATVYGAEQVKYLTSYLDPAGLGVINFRDFYRGISEIQNEDLDLQLYDMGYPSEEEPACSVDFDDLAAFEVTEVTDSAYVGSESAYSECETFTDEDTGALAAQEDPETEGDGGVHQMHPRTPPEGLEISLCDISIVTANSQEEQFEDFGEGAEPDLYSSQCDEEEENSLPQPVCSSSRLNSSPDKRPSSRKEARRLHNSSFLAEDAMERHPTDLAYDETDLTDKVLYLEHRVTELEREASTTGEQQNRLRQENLHLLHRAHALEEQLKDQELRSDEVQNEETRKHRDELRKMERDRGFELSSLKARVQELEAENFELRSQLPTAKATTQRLEEENQKLRDQVEELRQQVKENKELNQKLGGRLNKEKHKQQSERERSQEVIEELRRELEQMQLMRLEMEHRLGLGNSAALQEYNSRTRETELEQEVRRLKQEQRTLKDQNEELNGQIINLSIQGAKNLFSTTFSDSLAAEISSVSRDELMEAIQKQEDINLRLQDYIDRIIVAIMETNPAILEVKIH